MNYKKALEAVEQWLEEKHIRQFCRNACAGKCCVPTCDEEHHCQRPPLLCAMYLCSEMRSIMFGFHSGEKYGDITEKINKIVKNAGYDGIKIKDEYPDIEIPDDLINTLLSTEFKQDVHYK
jgi:hypothetical protein